MNPKKRILIVDDDKEILKLLSMYLDSQGFSVIPADCISAMDEALAIHTIDLIVLDVNLPDGNGLDACTNLRHQKIDIPIIMLSAMKEEVDRIVGFKMGADHYIGKPFSPLELVSIINSVFRRSSALIKNEKTPNIYTFDIFRLNLNERIVVTLTGECVPLTGAEFETLKVFVERPGRILSRDQILDFSRGHGSNSFDRSVDVLISRVRKKLRDAGGSTEIFKAVRNGGYHFTPKTSQILEA